MTEFNDNTNTNTNIITLVEAFNTKVNQAYQNHCDESGNCKLINQNMEPYLNIVYKLYDDGSVLISAGGNLYNSRSGSTGAYYIKNACRLPFKFALAGSNNITYVILTQEEIREFRNEMQEIITIAFDSGYLQSFNKEVAVQSLNERVIQAAKAHCDENGKCSLIIPDMSPNANTIYALYSDGTITSEKGGWAYGARSIFESKSKLHNIRLCNFNFGDKIASDGSSYVLLTAQECKEFRNEMSQIIKMCEQE